MAAHPCNCREDCGISLKTQLPKPSLMKKSPPHMQSCCHCCRLHQCHFASGTPSCSHHCSPKPGTSAATVSQQNGAPISLGVLRSRISFFFFFNIYLFIWLPRVLVAALGIFTDACRIFSCGMQDLVPGPPALGAQSLNHWTTREVPT